MLVFSWYGIAFFLNAKQGFPFHSGGLGVEGVFTRRRATVRNCRNRPPEGRMALPVVRGRFWRFQTWQAWHFVTSFLTCGKSFLCGRSNTFAKFSEDALHFLRQAQHFGDHHRHFAWQAQHFRRVLWLVLCESYCQGCLKW